LGTLPLSETASEIRSRLLADERDLTFAADGDLAYWQGVAAESTGPILEIGCGAGRILTALGAAERQLIGVDLDVAYGELLILAGPSGCGKTTLVSIVAILWAPPSGENRWTRLRIVITTRRAVVIQRAMAGPL
jgi:ABC-type multidrug transport system fused ATPase/permease subunit